MKRIILAGCLIGGVAVALVVFFLDPARVPIYPVCMFHRVTGLACPGCGSLRAMHQLLHGHVVAALRLNAFVVLSLPWFAWIGFRWIRSEMQRGAAIEFRPAWLWLYLAAFIAFGILRDLPIPFLASFTP